MADPAAPPSYQSMPPPPGSVAAVNHHVNSAGSERRVRLKGIGSWISLGGLYTSYDEEFPVALESVLSQAEFDRNIQKINDDLANNAPCCACQWAQYLCCPCTLGLSICCVRRLCMDNAHTTLTNDLRHANYAQVPADKRVEWSLGESCCDSWIEIEILER